MTITRTDGGIIFEPQNSVELSQWEPAGLREFQFLKISRQEYWIFHRSDYLGAATRLTQDGEWQAVSGSRGCCVAPLGSLLECAQCLFSALESRKERMSSAWDLVEN